MISERSTVKSKTIAYSAAHETKTPSGWYSFDDVVNAWETGKNSHTQKIMKAFKENLNLAQDICEKLFLRAAKELKIKCKSVRLKSIDIDSFSAIVVIPESDFVSLDKFNRISLLSHELTSQHHKGEFNLSILFMPNSKSVNEAALIADGYAFTYGEINKNRARKA